MIKVGDAPVPSVSVPAAAPTAAAVGPGTSVAVAGVEVYSPAGDPDNPGRASRVIDGDPTTSWRSYEYRQPFPALKPGVGLMVSFASAVQLSSLTISSPSPGSVVEVRSASTTDATLTDTTVMTQVTLTGGDTAVSLGGSQPVTHVLLWITKLGGGGDDNVTQVDEVRFQRAGG